MSGTNVSPAAAGTMFAALLARMNAGPLPAIVYIYAGTRPAPGAAAAGPLVCAMALQNPAGAVVSGALVLAVPSAGAAAQTVDAPSWARIVDGQGEWLLDLRARLSSQPDDPQDPAALVVQSTGVGIGALIRISSGAIAF